MVKFMSKLLLLLLAFGLVMAVPVENTVQEKKENETPLIVPVGIIYLVGLVSKNNHVVDGSTVSDVVNNSVMNNFRTGKINPLGTILLLNNYVKDEGITPDGIYYRSPDGKRLEKFPFEPSLSRKRRADCYAVGGGGGGGGGGNSYGSGFGEGKTSVYTGDSHIQISTFVSASATSG